MVGFLFALIGLFSLSITVRELWGEMSAARLLWQESRPVCTRILHRQGGPQQPFLAPETAIHWATWRRRPHPAAFPHFDTISESDGQTDGRTGGRRDLP